MKGRYLFEVQWFDCPTKDEVKEKLQRLWPAQFFQQLNFVSSNWAPPGSLRNAVSISASTFGSLDPFLTAMDQVLRMGGKPVSAVYLINGISAVQAAMQYGNALEEVLRLLKNSTPDAKVAATRRRTRAILQTHGCGSLFEV